jgi:hypothetical protein
LSENVSSDEYINPGNILTWKEKLEPRPLLFDSNRSGFGIYTSMIAEIYGTTRSQTLKAITRRNTTASGQSVRLLKLKLALHHQLRGER